MAIVKFSFSKEEQRIKDEYGKTVDWKEVGQRLEGVYCERKKEKGCNKSNIYVIQNENGRWAIWGTHILNRSFDEIPCPAYVRLIWQGKTKPNSSGRSVNCFSVSWAHLPEGFDIEHDILVDSEDNPNGERE